MGGITDGEHGSERPRSARERSTSGLPTWAARHLEESGLRPDLPATPTGRHRRPRRGAAADRGRLRGWGVAVAAVAAAAATVPLAITTLARDDAPVPRIGAFPAASPVDLPGGPDGGSRSGRAEPGPDAAALPPLDAPTVVPTSTVAPLAPPPPVDVATAPEPEPEPAPAVATTTSTPPSTTTTGPAPDEAQADDPTPRESTSPRADSSSGGSSPSRGSGGGSDRGSDRDSDRDSDRGLVGGLVEDVGGTVGGLLR